MGLKLFSSLVIFGCPDGIYYGSISMCLDENKCYSSCQIRSGNNALGSIGASQESSWLLR